MSHKIIVMFSGGLDSVMAAHLLKSQGLDVTALHFVLPFYSGMGMRPAQAESCADAIGVPLRVEEEGEEFLEMIRDPKFGYGKNANPCIDCRIHRLKKAGRIMEETGAVCLATGEVAGQRPMSQKLPTLQRVEKLAGLKGKLLRPLSAKLLPPTEAEIAGIIDRDGLLGISGRSRSVQLAYAKKHGLIHGAPAGGCILTNLETGVRFIDLMENDPQFSLIDFKLIAYGRHFRTSPDFRVIVSRDGDENDALEKIIAPVSSAPQSMPENTVVMYLRDTTGPVAFGLGVPGDDGLRFGAAAVVRFSKMRDAENAAVAVRGNIGNAAIDTVIETRAADDSEISRYRVASSLVR